MRPIATDVAWSVCLSFRLLNTLINRCMHMSLGVWTRVIRVGPSNRVLEWWESGSPTEMDALGGTYWNMTKHVRGQCTPKLFAIGAMRGDASLCYHYCNQSNKKLCWRRRTARRDVSVKILLTAAQQCRKKLYNKPRTNPSNGVRELKSTNK